MEKKTRIGLIVAGTVLLAGAAAITIWQLSKKKKDDLPMVDTDSDNDTPPIINPTPDPISNPAPVIVTAGSYPMKKGSKGAYVGTLQNLLLEMGANLAPYGADEDFGSTTEKELVRLSNKYAGLIGMPKLKGTKQIPTEGDLRMLIVKSRSYLKNNPLKTSSNFKNFALR